MITPIPAWKAPVLTMIRKLAQQIIIIKIVLPASTVPVYSARKMPNRPVGEVVSLSM